MSGLTSREIIGGLLGALSRTGGEHSSVSIGRTARGLVTYDVAVRTGEASFDTIDKARTEAQRQFDLLTAKYPPVMNGGTE